MPRAILGALTGVVCCALLLLSPPPATASCVGGLPNGVLAFG